MFNKQNFQRLLVIICQISLATCIVLHLLGYL